MQRKTLKAELCLDTQEPAAPPTEVAGAYAKWLAKEEKSIAKHAEVVRLEGSLNRERKFLRGLKECVVLMERSIRTDERKIAILAVKARLER